MIKKFMKHLVKLKMKKQNNLQKETIENLIKENNKLKKNTNLINILIYVLLGISIIQIIIILIPSVNSLTETISISPSVLPSLSIYSGENYTQNITLKTDGNYLVYISYLIENNSNNLEGLNIFYDSPIQVNREKTIPIIISTDYNFFPDSFQISFIASTEKAEEEKVIEFTQNQSIISGDLELNIISTGSGNITIKKFSDNPKSGFGIPSLNKFFQIDVSNSISEGMNETIIRVFYTDDEVNVLNIQESTLRLYYFNETSNEWIEQLGGVNIELNYVWANTNHFSLWGIFGSLPVSSSSSGSSSNGGGICYRGWTTSNWSDCINNKKTRNIEKDWIKCYQVKQEEPLKEKYCESTTCQGDECLIIPPEEEKKDYLPIYLIGSFILLVIVLIIYYANKSDNLKKEKAKS